MFFPQNPSLTEALEVISVQAVEKDPLVSRSCILWLT